MRSSGRGAEHVDLDHLDWVEDRTAACTVGRRPQGLGAAERVGPGAGPGTTRHRAPLERASRLRRRLRRPRAPLLRDSPERRAPRRAVRPRAARRSRPATVLGPGVAERRALYARHLPARRLRPRHGLQRLGRPGVLRARQQLLLLRPPGRVGRHRRRTMYVLSRVDYAWFRKAAVPLAGLALAGLLLVLVPGRRQPDRTAPAAGSTSVARACSPASSPSSPRSCSWRRSS